MSDPPDANGVGPHGVVATMDELMRHPRAGIERAGSGIAVHAWAGRILAGSVVCCALYGAAGGFFQGGSQIWIAAAKAPLIVLWSAALSLPSLYVFSAIGGVPLTRARFAVTLAGFVGMIALVLVGLLPIDWLFSVSSRSLESVVWLHLALWTVALAFGARFLSLALPEVPRGAVRLWVLLFCVVAFQVTTLLRPTLLRAPGDPIVERGKRSFIEQFDRATR